MQKKHKYGCAKLTRINYSLFSVLDNDYDKKWQNEIREINNCYRDAVSFFGGFYKANKRVQYILAYKPRFLGHFFKLRIGWDVEFWNTLSKKFYKSESKNGNFE